ncbi:MAG: diacylglycerol kinase family lipid kinase [Candidatus Marinimicrobia bacterium]|nr:diacylglycerol kinase family lipid kinase [Candidatus Neomarinimicrobiota bacterium]
MTRKFAVIVNPAAGRGRVAKHLPNLKEITDQTRHKFDYYYTREPFHAAQISDKIHREYDAVIAFGGDGTANEVMNGIAGTTTPFGIIPDGTGNDFARSIAVSKNLQKAVDTIIDYKIRLMDLGTIGERVFLNAVGIGFDGFVNYRNKKVKILKGSLSYLYAVLSSLTLWKAIPIKIEIDGKILGKGYSFLLAIGNGWSVGGGLKLTPQASINDSVFDICHISDIPIWKIILNFVRLKNGTLDVVKEVTLRKGSKINVKSDCPLPVHFDGELYDVNAKEIEISIVPQSAFVIGEWSV